MCEYWKHSNLDKEEALRIIKCIKQLIGKIIQRTYHTKRALENNGEGRGDINDNKELL